MNFYSLKCPHCSADLKPIDGLNSFFCPFCGGKVILEGQDEDVLKAKIRDHDSKRKRIEKDEEIEREYRRKEKELEYERKKDIESNRSILRTYKTIGIIFVCFMILVSIFEAGDRRAERAEEKRIQEQQSLIDAMEDKNVSIGLSSDDFKNMDWYDAKKYFKNLGFIYVNTLEIKHTKAENKTKGGVAYITINGVRSFHANAIFPLDAKIYIAYYETYYSSD